jgi:hypothetical protein
MIHSVTLYRVRADVDEKKLDQMMISARVSMLKIPEVQGVRTGKNVDPGSPWGFFVALDVESMDRLKLVHEDAVYIKFQADILSGAVEEQFVANYEMQPGKSIKYA